MNAWNMAPKISVDTTKQKVIKRFLGFYFSSYDAPYNLCVGLIATLSVLFAVPAALMAKDLSAGQTVVFIFIATITVFSGLTFIFIAIVYLGTRLSTEARPIAAKLLDIEGIVYNEWDLVWPIMHLVRQVYDEAFITEGNRSALDQKTPPAPNKSRPSRL